MHRQRSQLTAVALISVILIVFGLPACQSETAGTFLGQAAPGLTPEVFAPGIISIDQHRDRDVTFTPDLGAIYFTRDAAIMRIQPLADGWTEATPASFASGYNEFEPFITHDGQRLYYISQRPLLDTGKAEAYQVWYVDREGDGWGEPIRLSDRGDYYPTLTHDSVLYMTGADNDLYRCRLVDGAPGPIERLGDSVNTVKDEYNACIAPDGSCLVFTSHGWGDGFGGGDLFVSFRKPDGTFTAPYNLGVGINTSALEYCPAFSPDMKYLFFVSRRSNEEDIYWVDASRLDSARTVDLNLCDRLYTTMQNQSLEAVKKQYADMSTTYGAYARFDGDLLISLSNRLLGDGRGELAIALIRMGFELHPKLATPVRRIQLAVLEDDTRTLQEIADELVADSTGLTRQLELRINQMGYQLMFKEDVTHALDVFALNVRLFPASVNVHDSHGEALAVAGDTTGAIASYRKCLELDPENANAAKMLEQLGDR